MSGSKLMDAWLSATKLLLLYIFCLFFMLCDVNVPQASQFTTYNCVNVTKATLTYKVN